MSCQLCGDEGHELEACPRKPDHIGKREFDDDAEREKAERNYKTRSRMYRRGAEL